jgi:hypothetical protein
MIVLARFVCPHAHPRMTALTTKAIGIAVTREAIAVAVITSIP